MISIRNLYFQYPSADFRLAIDDLHIGPGEKVALVGPSGSGKTTLLNLISGISLAHGGTVRVFDQDIAQLSDSDRRDFRIAQIGFVFQRFELIEYLNVKDNILFSFLINRSIALRPDVLQQMQELTDAVGIANLLQRYPKQLSQGEKQRVAICRALIRAPQLILADEPTGNLDPVNKHGILDLMFNKLDAPERSFVVVTHDETVANRCDRKVDFLNFHRTGDEPTGAAPPQPASDGGKQ